jgi:hypothetical protein
LFSGVPAINQLETNVIPPENHGEVFAIESTDTLHFQQEELLNNNLDSGKLFPIAGSSRDSPILGKLIHPGNHTGSVSPSSNPFDLYTIYFNGTSIKTDFVTIEMGTVSSSSAVLSFQNPDRFVIDYKFFNSGTGPLTIMRAAITSGYHYIAVGNYISGTTDYWMNITVAAVTNNKNEGNNDFGNITTAAGGSKYSESLNKTLDYWDLYKITIPVKKNLTVTAEPTDPLEITIEGYDAPNSSDVHKILDINEHVKGGGETLYYETTDSPFILYLRIHANPTGDDQGNYYLNFTIKDPNKGPRINLTDPNLNYWTTTEGLLLKEDEAKPYFISLNDHFSDDGFPAVPGNLEFSYLKNEDNITVSIHENNSVSITPAANWFGEGVVITFYADDSEYIKSDSINLSVESVNDPPTLSDIMFWPLTNGSRSGNKFKVSEGTATTIQVKATDPDTNNLFPPIDDLYFSAELLQRGSTKLVGLPSNFTINENTGLMVYNPINAEVGTFYLNITVRDRYSLSTGEILMDWMNVTFSVENVNNKPSFQKIYANGNNYAVFSHKLNLPPPAIQDEEFIFYVYVTDLDVSTPSGDELTIEINPDYLFTRESSAISNVAIYSFIPDNDLALTGSVQANLTVKDSDRESDYLNLIITIKNKNDPPKFEKISMKPVPSNKFYEFKGFDGVDPYGSIAFIVEATDIDINDKLEFSTTNISLTQGFAPELYIEQDSGEKYATITFDPLASRAGTSIILNLTVTDNGQPKLNDWLNVLIEIFPEEEEEPEYTLTAADCEKTYLDPDNDVFVYERDVNGGISTSKGEYQSIDIISIQSKKDEDDLVITVKFRSTINKIAKDCKLYVVRESFNESGVHLQPKNYKDTDWDNHPYGPASEDIYSDFILEYFQMNTFADFFYTSVIVANTWEITIGLESFESYFGVNHENNKFEFFALSYDHFNLQVVVGSTNILGPKAYDSAGYGAATAPEVLKDKKQDSSGGLSSWLWIIIIVIIIVVVVIIALAAFMMNKKRKAEEAAGSGQVTVLDADGKPTTYDPSQYPQALPPGHQRTCQNCGSFLSPQDVTYCPNCGEWLHIKDKELKIDCMKCGMRIPEGRYVCPFCSTPVPPDKLAEVDKHLTGAQVPIQAGSQATDGQYGQYTQYPQQTQAPYGQAPQQPPQQPQPPTQTQVTQEMSYAQVQYPPNAQQPQLQQPPMQQPPQQPPLQQPPPQQPPMQQPPPQQPPMQQPPQQPQPQQPPPQQPPPQQPPQQPPPQQPPPRYPPQQ